MNKSGIEWCDHTWNPITGCRHGCSYCYADKMSLRFCGNMKRNMVQTDQYRMEGDLFVLDEPFMNEDGKPVIYPFGFEPTLHIYRYGTLDKLKQGQNIFVGAMADIFGEWVPDSWIDDILGICEKHPQHNYLFLTKNPARYNKLALRGKLPQGDNYWYGSTITNPDDVFWFCGCHNTFVNVEPILAEFPLERLPPLEVVKWAILGAMTGPGSKEHAPGRETIYNIVKAAGSPIFMKDSLVPIVGEENMRREFPWEANRSRREGRTE